MSNTFFNSLLLSSICQFCESVTFLPQFWLASSVLGWKVVSNSPCSDNKLCVSFIVAVSTFAADKQPKCAPCIVDYPLVFRCFAWLRASCSRKLADNSHNTTLLCSASRMAMWSCQQFWRKLSNSGLSAGIISILSTVTKYIISTSIK